MMIPRDPAHYLIPLTSDNLPRRMLWLDCAATVDKQQGASVERWRCGALGRTWYTAKAHVRKDTVSSHDMPLSLWMDADEFCTANRRVVLWAYDLAHQMRLSQALVHLPNLGWHLDKIVLERTAAWATFRDGNRSLLMCDLKSWTPAEYATLRAAVRDNSDDVIGTVAGVQFHSMRCESRVSVVRDAVLQILAWLSAEGLGPFRPTGSGQSYAAFRRRFMSHQLLAHDDGERIHAERVAMWTGRCEAWQHGELRNGPYVEYDMQAAYCRIAAECDVPTEAVDVPITRKLQSVIDRAERYSILAHITVKTAVPVLPARMAGRTIWPVGTFSTWVWDPELRLAVENCDHVTVHKAYAYKRAPALQSFARLVLDGLGPQTTVYGEVPPLVLKHWSRCLVGRLGLRYRSWLPFGTSPVADLRLTTIIDCDEGTSTDMLIAGHDRMVLSDMSESPDSMPQIPSWIMSECRRRLWQAMHAVGMPRVVYIDTDSIIVQDAEPFTSISALGNATHTIWSRKARHASLTIHGPRNYSTQSERHISGLPRSARQLAPLEFSGQIMRSIKESMRNGELDCVASIPRKFVMDAPDMRRQHLPNHITAPFMVQLPQEDY